MKFAFMSFSALDKNFKEMTELAKELGYDGVELRLEQNHAHGVSIEASDEHIQEVMKISKESGIEICCLAVTCHFASKERAEETFEKAKKSIDLAAKMGVKCIRVFGGGYSTTYEESCENMAYYLTQLSDYIGDRDVKVCVETHDVWFDPAKLAPVLAKVNRPNICVNWDVLHTTLKSDKSVAQAFEILKPYIAHVHMHDGVVEGDLYPNRLIGKGDIDHRILIKLLEENNYQGYMSGEWMKWEEPNYLEKEIKTLREMERSIKEEG